MQASALLAEGETTTTRGLADDDDVPGAEKPLSDLGLVSSAASFGSAAAMRSSRVEVLLLLSLLPLLAGKSSTDDDDEERPPSSSPASSAADSLSVSSHEDHSHAACSSAVAVEIAAEASSDAA